MKIVLMQPYFFPYIGYFTLIKHSDLFVVFDTAQYIRRGWVHRNRILGTDGEPVYINASIFKSPRDTPIRSVRLNDSLEWKEQIIRSLSVYQGKAPYYKETLEIVEECLRLPTFSLSELNIHILKTISGHLAFEYTIQKLSDMDIPFENIEEPDDWGLQLAKFCGAQMYINAPGGQAIYSKEKYGKEGIELAFYEANLKPYDQRLSTFHKGLSVIDVMMFNSKEEINKMLDDYTVL